MKTPKQRFLESPAHRAYMDFAHSPALEAAIDVALLEMQDSFSPKNADDAAKNQFMLMGARQFASALTGLCDPPPIKKPSPRQNLED